MTFTYRAHFELTNPVTDTFAAHKYLTDDDMTKYLLNDIRGTEKVTKVEWLLQGPDFGYIQVTANQELTDEEKTNISSWIRGQCSDGLGEGFEQQSFAEYEDPDYEPYMDDYFGWFGNGYIRASFDWESNEYDLHLISEEH